MQYETKRLIVSALYLVVWPFGLVSNLYKFFGNDAAFAFSSQLLSLVPGKTGQYIRTAFYKMTLTNCHYDLMVGFCSFFLSPRTTVGRKVGLGSFTIVGSGAIGDNVMISSRVAVSNAGPGHDDTQQTSVRDENISIGEGCWIGEGAVIVASLGRQCIVSAGSVVSQPSLDRVVAIGNPARFLKIAENTSNVG